MGRGSGGGHAGVWVFGGLLMIGVLVLIGVLVWAIITWTNRARRSAVTEPAEAHQMVDRGRTRQILDERYAGGEMTTSEYTERLQTLGL